MAEADQHFSSATGARENDPMRLGQIERGQLLDAFASLEASLTKLVERAGAAVDRTGPLAAKLSDLKKIEAKLKSPKTVAELRDRISELASIRASVVHSQLEYAMRSDGFIVWLFKNIGQTRPGALALDTLDFQAFARELRQLSHRLNQMQARSPTPTAPAATTATAKAR